MRPKIVILILVAAIGVVALAAVLQAVMGRHAPQEAKAPEPPPAQSAHPTAEMPPEHPNSSNTAAMLEQMRVAEIDRELDQIRELQAAGAASEYATETLLHKTTHHEPQVRKAAVDALVQLDATNAIPGLEQAVSLIDDPREKVVFMDAVSYLKLPGVTDGAAPEMALASNYPASAASPRKVVLNPRFLKQGRRQALSVPGAAQPVAPANPGQTQPASPAPDAAPPASPAPDAAPPQ